MKRKNGFTLIELIVTIGVIFLVFGLSVIGITSIIKASKENGIALTIDNIKNSAVMYASENVNNIKWINSNVSLDNNNNESNNASTDNKEFTCVSINSLINSGYYDKKLLNNDVVNVDDFVRINRDGNSKTIINEEIENEEKLCSKYFVSVPKCLDIEYTGAVQSLIDFKNSNNMVSVEYNGGDTDKTDFIDTDKTDFIDAGKYNFSVSLKNDNYSWDDGTSGVKELTCNIKPRNLNIYINGVELEEKDFTGNIYNKKDEFMNNNYVTFDDLLPGHKLVINNIRKNDEGNKIVINKEEDIVIIDENNSDLTKNYAIKIDGGDLTLISKPKIDIPKCNNLIYNGESQDLVLENDNYILDNNLGMDAGEYNNIKASINGDYLWEDNTSEDKIITCNIGKADAKSVVVKDSLVNYNGSNITSNRNDVIVTGINDEIVDDGNASFKYYTNSSCTGSFSNYINNIGTYYVQANVTGMKNYNDKSSNCARVDVTSKLVVTFDPNGGSLGNNPKSKEYNSNSNYGNLYSLTRNGYKFEGWYTEKINGNKISSTFNVGTVSHTVYAHWTSYKLDVCYHPNGGTIKDAYKSVTKCDNNKGYLATVLTYDEALQYNLYNVRTLFSRTGYVEVSDAKAWLLDSTKSGKYVNQAGANLSSYIKTGNKTINLYANWKVMQVKVVYHTNYGTNLTASQSFTYGVSGNRFGYEKGKLKWGNSGQFGKWDRAGYTLKGWSTDHKAKDKRWSIYSNVTDNWIINVYNNKYESNDNHTINLYAVWVDDIKPTCNVSKSNTNKSSGVTITVSCSDAGTGCAKICTGAGKCGTKKSYTYNNQDSNRSFTVYDKAGNKSSCSASVSSYCHQYKSCRNSSCSCQTYKSCRNSSCSCAKSTSTSTYYCIAAYKSHCPSSGWDYFSKSGKGCTVTKSSMSGTKIYAIQKCTTTTCNKYNSCRDSSCGCETYYYK